MNLGSIFGRIALALIIVITIGILPTTLITLTDGINLNNVSFATDFLEDLGYSVALGSFNYSTYAGEATTANWSKTTPYSTYSGQSTTSNYTAAAGTATYATYAGQATTANNTGTGNVTGDFTVSRSITSYGANVTNLLDFGRLQSDYVLVTSNYTPGGTTYVHGWPKAVYLPTGKVWATYAKMVGGTFTGYIPYKTSTTYGRTWSSEQFITSLGSTPKMVLGLVVTANNSIGMTYYTTATDSLSYYTSSADEGVTWTPPITITWSFTGAKTSGIDGFLELPGGRLVTVMSGYNTGDSYRSVHVKTSDTGGATWSADIVMANGQTDSVGYDETGIVSVNATGIRALIRGWDSVLGDYAYFKTSTSSDSGDTWSAPVVTFRGFGDPRMKVLSDGRTLVSYRRFAGAGTGSGSEDPYVVPAMRVSYDYGANWSAEMLFDGRYTRSNGGDFVEITPGNVAHIYGVQPNDNQGDIYWANVNSIIGAPVSEMSIGARVYSTAVISTNTSSAYILPFNAERYDPYNMHVTGSDNNTMSRIYVRTPGKYLVTATITYDTSAVGYRQILLYAAPLAGSAVIIGGDITGGNTTAQAVNKVSTIWDFQGGEYIYLTVTQNSGGALLLLNDIPAWTELAIHRLGS